MKWFNIEHICCTNELDRCSARTGCDLPNVRRISKEEAKVLLQTNFQNFDLLRDETTESLVRNKFIQTIMP